MPRQPEPGPPKGFRPHMGLQVKLEACLLALGLDPASVHYDHQPSLQQRVYDPEIGDTRPAANDPRHIVPLGVAAHREKTAKTDVPQIAKTRRLSKAQEEHRRRMLEPTQRQPEDRQRPKAKIQSRGFTKKVKT